MDSGQPRRTEILAGVCCFKLAAFPGRILNWTTKATSTEEHCLSTLLTGRASISLTEPFSSSADRLHRPDDSKWPSLRSEELLIVAKSWFSHSVICYLYMHKTKERSPHSIRGHASQASQRMDFSTCSHSRSLPVLASVTGASRCSQANVIATLLACSSSGLVSKALLPCWSD
jgi:hypothetical protein